MTGRTYLDWNATAPLRPEARAAMVAAWEVAGNPSSVHAEGRAAKMLVERAREEVAAAVGCRAAEVVFTSGATEAIAGALMAFTLSIDDFVITFFTAGAGTVTLPLQIYSMIKIAVTPEVNAVSTLLMLLTLMLIVIASKVSPSLLRSE